MLCFLQGTMLHRYDFQCWQCEAEFDLHQDAKKDFAKVRHFQNIRIFPAPFLPLPKASQRQWLCFLHFYRSEELISKASYWSYRKEKGEYAG